MAYSDFDLRKVLTDFGLRDESGIGLFESVAPLSPSTTLTEWLSEYVSYAVAVNSEKARSEYIITPIFAEARRLAGRTFQVMPGVSFDVDKSKGLNGVCDYLVTKSGTVYYIRGPLAAVAEGKRDNVTDGLGQCAAEMVAIKQFNEREQTPRLAVYGCVTTGTQWLFLKLEGDSLMVDKTEYYLHDLPKLLGILVSVCG